MGPLSDSVRGIMAGIDIWEIGVIPYLLNNSGVWGDIPKKAMEMLDSLQNTFYRYILGAPRSTPTPALLWETGGLSMACRINIRKLTFYHHVMSLDGRAIASRVANLAARAGFPGLIREYKELCAKYNLPCARTVSKQVWKKLVKRAVTDANRINLLEQIQSRYKKLDHNILVNEQYETKQYFKTLRLSNARLKFRIRTKMVEKIAFNYSSDAKYVNRLWQCTHCECIDSQAHVLTCVGYQHLREGKNLASDSDLVSYFRDVISLRDKLEDII